MKYGFVKAAAATPKIRVADCNYNANQIIDFVSEACNNGAKIVVFPELCVTGYTCSDLFLQTALLKSAENAVRKVQESSKSLDTVIVIGAPIAVMQSLYNCAVVIYKGEILGIVPKVNIPNYGEFYEVRHFASGKDVSVYIDYADSENILLSPYQIFECADMPDFKFGIEICEDLWVASSPSVQLALNGATVICNLSSSDDLIGKAQYRHELVRMQSGKLYCAYIYSDSGFGESTTDMVFSGHNII